MSKKTEAKRRRQRRKDRAEEVVKIEGKVTIIVESVPNPDYPDQPDARARVGHTGKLPNPEEVIVAAVEKILAHPILGDRAEEAWGTKTRCVAAAMLLLESRGTLDDFEEDLILAKVDMIEAAEMYGEFDDGGSMIRAELDMTPDRLRELADNMEETGCTVINIMREDTSEPYVLMSIQQPDGFGEGDE